MTSKPKKLMCGIPIQKVVVAYEVWNTTSLTLVQVARGMRLNYTKLYCAIRMAENRGLSSVPKEGW